ncbi:FadR/GntR family transcriptional regulator [Lacrimispora sp. 210928-DFI.3.58]|uniref:FadR/GntR family transcriptional regulator n=1 Tax=Lacrimispora sp. 210928-DFI.3.58 TaxID=2883214 RepID=UPI001D08D44C|nr:FadR/GntR family transcriptional regulator [Lacrimispora sp. 210928-DFI.3.58]MCB7318684.1 FadR family transcriptional regulator [Lacrimispora sp. 210928-DFI.3.58]
MNTIEKNNLVEEAYNQIINMIATGEWDEGSKLPSENTLCEILGVSRNTVRQALNRITALGIIETRQGYGYQVRNLNTGIYLNSLLPTMLLRSKDLESITEFRIGIESEAAALAAVRADEEDLERMRINCEMAEKAVHGQDDVFAQYDMAFHRAVAEASKNELFIKTAEMLETMYTVWLMGFQRTHGKDASHDFHYNIYLSIKNRNPSEAKRYMHEHLEDVLRKVKIDKERKTRLGEAKQE